MEDVFITKIELKEVRNLKGFQIPLSATTKKNLILTGKNGSGKTTVLKELKKYISQALSGFLDQYSTMTHSLEIVLARKKAYEEKKSTNESELYNIENDLKSLYNWFEQFGGARIEFNNINLLLPAFRQGDFIIAFFEAKRNTSLKTPTGVNKIKTKPAYRIEDKAGNEFIQYIVNLKADRSFAKDEDDFETVKKIDNWFTDFEQSLYQLFDDDKIELQFNRKLYNFDIIEDSKEPYNLNQLSDGYSAILNIVTELIMRMEEHKAKSYDVGGIVLIDEIETHLHIELQKKVLPFLTSFFPNVQFIVTTHSPFVLSSIENAIICDLEKKIVTSDLTGYSYDTLIESYFNSDKYSTDLKNKIDDYEKLKEKQDPTEEDKEKIHRLKIYFNEIPKFLSDEIVVKLQQIKLKDLKKKEL